MNISTKLMELSEKYLALHALHNSIVEKEIAIEKEVLSIITLYNDGAVEIGFEEKRRITEPFDIGLSHNEQALKEYYELVDEKMRKAGIKPNSMKVETYPSCIISKNINSLNKEIIQEAQNVSIIDVEFADGLMLDVDFYDTFLFDITNACILRKKELNNECK